MDEASKNRQVGTGNLGNVSSDGNGSNGKNQPSITFPPSSERVVPSDFARISLDELSLGQSRKSSDMGYGTQDTVHGLSLSTAHVPTASRRGQSNLLRDLPTDLRPLTENPDNLLGLQKSKLPHIKKLDQTQYLAALDDLEMHLAGWSVVTPPEIPKEDDFVPSDPDGRTHQERWNARLRSTHTMVGEMRINTVSDDPLLRVAYSCVLSKVSVGVMFMSNKDTPSIVGLVTHPGTFRAGGILLEQAVQTSFDWKKGGRLSLLPESEDAIAAFEAYGFVFDPADDSGRMILVPAKSDKWSDETGQYKLKQYMYDDINR